MIFLEKLVLLSILNVLAFTSSSQSDQKKLLDLPSESDDWFTIRKHNLFYIDKTPYLKKYVQNPEYKLGILTRPRRFGKSIFLEMMKNFFEGRENLFKGLSIEEDGNNFSFFANDTTDTSNLEKWIKFPVIYINFCNIGNFETITAFWNKYETALLVPNAREHNIPYESANQLSLSYIIRSTYQMTNLKVVILVDEYDSLVHQQFMKKNYVLADELLSFTENFLGEIKNSVMYIGIAFVVGVSTFAPSCSQSGANNFIDVTHKPELATAFGITVEELDKDMNDYLEEYAKSFNVHKNKAKDDFIKWYDGYNFNIEDLSDKFKVLNPVSTIKCLNNKRLASYWTGTSSLNFILQEFYNSYPRFTKEMFINDYTTSIDYAFQKFKPYERRMSLPSILLRYGCLTITSYDVKINKIKLKYPNSEITNTIKDGIIAYVPSHNCTLKECVYESKQLFNAMKNGNAVQSIKILRDWAFRDFLPPSDNNAIPDEITRRLQLVFEASGINYKEGVNFTKDSQPTHLGGYIDFLTLNLPINYAISVKCGLGGTALDAIMQLVKYTRENPKSFNDAMVACKVNTTKVYFLGVSFSYVKGSNLRDWIAVSYTDSCYNIDLNTTQADSEDLKEKFKREIILSPTVKMKE